MEDIKSFGQFIGAKRKALGVNQGVVAGKMGVSQPLVAQWEQGKKGVSEKHLPALALALDISHEELERAWKEFPRLDTQKESPVLGLLRVILSAGFEDLTYEEVCRIVLLWQRTSPPITKSEVAHAIVRLRTAGG